jgi:hypothetical protein
MKILVMIRSSQTLIRLVTTVLVTAKWGLFPTCDVYDFEHCILTFVIHCKSCHLFSNSWIDISLPKHGVTKAFTLLCVLKQS